MSTQYLIRLRVPGTSDNAAEWACPTLLAVAARALALGHEQQDERLYDEHGEITVEIVRAGGASLSEEERRHLDALIQEHGGATPRDGEADTYRERNPRRRP